MVREDLNRNGETTPSKTEITVREDLNRRALENYDGSPEAMYQIKTLEREICTPYYAILTMNAIDLKQYCKDMRKKYDVPQI